MVMNQTAIRRDHALRRAAGTVERQALRVARPIAGADAAPAIVPRRLAGHLAPADQVRLPQGIVIEKDVLNAHCRLACCAVAIRHYCITPD